MKIEKNQCYSDKKLAVGWILANFEAKDYDLAKKIVDIAFSFNENNDRLYSIKFYTTASRYGDIRFCIDRGQDCNKSKISTHFLVLSKGCEIHVRDSGDAYMKKQDKTDFVIIKGYDVYKIGVEKVRSHILKSYCRIIESLGLSSSPCPPHL